MSKTLLLQSEVGKFHKYGRNIVNCNIDDIALVETDEFSECLGTDFYKFLKAHLADYSDAKAWKQGEIIEDGCAYRHKRCYWIACQQTDENDQPIPITSEPSSKSNEWKLGEKFTEDCLNSLWCEGFLGKYIDAMVQLNVGVELSMELNENGWRKSYGKSQSGESLDAKDIAIRVKMLKSKTAKIFKHLDLFMRENQECGCYDLYKGLDKAACKTCGCHKKTNCKCHDEQNCVDKKASHYDIGFA